MRLPRNPLPSSASFIDEPPAVGPELAAAAAQYRIDPTPFGWRIVRFSADNGGLDGFDAVLHRLRDVAEAYVAAASALEAYLSSLDRSEDASDLFETWRDLDDRYELLSIERRDFPTFVAAPSRDVWAPATNTRH